MHGSRRRFLPRKQTARPAPPPASEVVRPGPGRGYRYDLWRRWDSGHGTCLFILLHPGAPLEVERCQALARTGGFAAVRLQALFAYLAPTAGHLLERVVPLEGPLNRDYLRDGVSEAARIVVAWGSSRDPRVRAASARYSDLCRARGKVPYCVEEGRERAPLAPRSGEYAARSQFANCEWRPWSAPLG